MGASVESVVFGWVGTQRPSRVLCASCRRLFDAKRPTTGERVRCTHCREIVEIGFPVVRKSRRHSSRTSIATWVDTPRNAGSEAVVRAAIVVALLAAVVFLVPVVSGVEASLEPALVFHGDDYATNEGTLHW
jgi:hypothetical protein